MLEPVVNLGSSFINPKFCDVNIQLSKASLDNVAATPATAAPPPTNKYPKVPFLVTVLIDDLWIRKTPNGANVKFIPKNTYTIVEVKDGCWGKLKSGAGWICLDYTKKV